MSNFRKIFLFIITLIVFTSVTSCSQIRTDDKKSVSYIKSDTISPKNNEKNIQPTIHNSKTSTDKQEKELINTKKLSETEAVTLAREFIGNAEIFFDNIYPQTEYYKISWANPKRGMSAFWLIDPYTGDIYSWQKNKLGNIIDKTKVEQ